MEFLLMEVVYTGVRSVFCTGNTHTGVKDKAFQSFQKFNKAYVKLWSPSGRQNQ